MRTLLFAILDTVDLVHTRTVVGWITTERDFKRGQELVHTGQKRLGRRGGGGDSGFTLEHDDTVGEIRSHDEIVLDNEGGLLGVEDESNQR